MGNLTDMNFIQMFIHNGSGLGSSYPNDLPIGHIDHSIFGPSDGMMSRPKSAVTWPASTSFGRMVTGRTFRAVLPPCDRWQAWVPALAHPLPEWRQTQNLPL